MSSGRGGRPRRDDSAYGRQLRGCREAHAPLSRKSDCDGCGEERTHRCEDCSHAVIDGHTVVLRQSARHLSRRPRRDNVRRCRARPLQLGQHRRAAALHPAAAASQRAHHRHERQREIAARAPLYRSRQGVGGERGVSAEPRADIVNHGGSRHGRRTRSGTDEAARLQTARFRTVPSGRRTGAEAAHYG